MIATIGFIIGSYVQVRMISFLTRTGDSEEARIVKTFAVINMIITGILMLTFIFGGGESRLSQF